MAALVAGCEGDRRVAEALRRALRWRWPLIVLAFLPSALIAVTLVERQPERHEAVSVIAVVPEGPELANTDLIQLAVDRYVVVLQSESALRRIAQESEWPYPLRISVSMAAARRSRPTCGSSRPARQALEAGPQPMQWPRRGYGWHQRHDRSPSRSSLRPPIRRCR